MYLFNIIKNTDKKNRILTNILQTSLTMQSCCDSTAHRKKYIFKKEKHLSSEQCSILLYPAFARRITENSLVPRQVSHLCMDVVQCIESPSNDKQFQPLGRRKLILLQNVNNQSVILCILTGFQEPLEAKYSSLRDQLILSNFSNQTHFSFLKPKRTLFWCLLPIESCSNQHLSKPLHVNIIF